MRGSGAALLFLTMATASQAGVMPEMNEPTGAVEIFDEKAHALLRYDMRPVIRAQGFAWTEGPLWIDEGGYLLFSDIPNNAVHKYEPGRGTSVYLDEAGATGLFEGDYGGGSNGLLQDDEGRLILMQHGDRRVAVMDAPLHAPQPRFTTLADRHDGERLNSPNDGVYRSNGSLYFTDPPYGLPGLLEDERKELAYQGIYRLDPDGSLHLLDDTVSYPNGIGLSPDEQTLYVAVSDRDDAHWLAYDVTPDGSLANKRVFFDASKWAGKDDWPGYPDGMAVHSSGWIFATGPGGVWLFTPEGEPVALARTGRATANVALSADERTLYITAHDTLMSLDLPVATTRATQQSRQPNIVLIFSDDAGYADFGFHGSRDMRTPNLDELARTGVRFTQGYVAHPTCGPSRAGLMTGRYPQRFGYEENNVPGYMSPNSALLEDDMGLPLDEVTMAEHLKTLGYATGVFGKWHLGNADRFHPTRRGFDEFVGFRGGARSYFAYPDGVADRSENRLEHGFGEYREPGAYLTDVLGDAAVEFIERNAEMPFFLYLSFSAPHAPMQATDADLAEFPELEGMRKTLAAMMLAMDRASGKVLAKLDELELSDDTIVVFTNDNGGPSDANASSNYPFAGTKSTQLEGGVRVPFLIRWPARLGANTTYNMPVSTLDLLPTFISAAGGDAEKLDSIDGVDLLPYLLDEVDGHPHTTLYWKRDVRATVREGDWKLMRFPDRPAELYNLTEDIAEQNNLADEYPELTRELYKKIFAWELTTQRPRWLLKRQYEKSDIERMDEYRTPPDPP